MLIVDLLDRRGRTLISFMLTDDEAKPIMGMKLKQALIALVGLGCGGWGSPAPEGISFRDYDSESWRRAKAGDR